jgi:hypothetical protein
MGVVNRLFMGRWFSKWLLRGGPWTVGAKLAGVAAYGVWRWRREQRKLEREDKDREIPADYEVLGSGDSAEGKLAEGRRSLPRSGRPLNGGPGGTPNEEVV